MATCAEIFNRALETFQIYLHLRILGATLETVIFSIAVGLNAFRDYRDRLYSKMPIEKLKDQHMLKHKCVVP